MLQHNGSGTLSWATGGWTPVTTTMHRHAERFRANGLSGNTIVRCNNATLISRSPGSPAGARRAATDQIRVESARGNVDFVVYDATTARWRLTTHEQGGWITPTYAAGNYTAQTGTWTVDAGDVTTQAYYLKGRTLTVAFNLVTTSVSATPTFLNIVNGGVGRFHQREGDHRRAGLQR
jgi:hypothetical protein